MRALKSLLGKTEYSTVMAIASPVVACFVACAVFMTWAGFSTARSVEDTLVRTQAENVTLVAGYMQHLIADCRANTAMLTERRSRGLMSASADDLAAYVEDTHSRSHLRGIAVLDGRGEVQIDLGQLSDDVRALLRTHTPRLARAETEILLPLTPTGQRNDIPGFLYIARIAGQDDAFIAFVVEPGLSGQPSSFKIANIDEPFAMIDTATGTGVAFGAPSRVPWLETAGAMIAGTRTADDSVGVFCAGNMVLDRHCAAYHMFAGSPLALVGWVSGERLRSQWLHENGPFWFFALLVLLGGAVSAVVISAWAQQRRESRRRLDSALAEITRAYAAKSNFMAHLSHELRTPLNSIIGFSDVIRGAYFGPLNDRYRGYAEDIHLSASHLNKIASEIMDAERLERGEVNPEPGSADLNQVASDCARMLSVLAAQRGVSLAVSPWATAATVGMNAHRATQIGVNLISNAVKYSERGDHVSVDVARMPGGFFKLTVTDEGIGMTAQEISYTERPFGQPADRRSGRHDSVGLGLPIVRGLLATIGGQLVISSEKNRGTTVSAVFGPCPRTTGAAAETSEIIDGGTFQGPREAIR